MEEKQATAEDFHREMLWLYEKAKQLGIQATRFVKEVRQYGGVNAAKRFLLKGDIKEDPWDSGQLEGVTLLIEAEGKLKNLQYTSEALVLKPQYRHLFTEAERQKACARLKLIDPSWPCSE